MRSNARQKTRKNRVQIWKSNAEWTMGLIDKFVATPSVHGIKWTDKMVAHYSKHLEDYILARPATCKKQAEDLRSRLNIALAKLGKLHDNQ